MQNRGFTLVEGLVVVATVCCIIVVSVVLARGVVQEKQRGKAEQQQNVGNCNPKFDGARPATLSQLPKNAHSFAYVNSTITDVLNWQTQELRDIRLLLIELNEKIEKKDE